MDLITKSIEEFRLATKSSLQEVEQSFVLSALESIASINGLKPVERVGRGKNVSEKWAFYPFHKRNLCKLNTKFLSLRDPIARQIREDRIPIIINILTNIQLEMDKDATIRKLSDWDINQWDSGVLRERNFAIEMVKACIAPNKGDNK